MQDRYHNLNALTNHTNIEDPLIKWDTILKEIIGKELPRKKIAKICSDAATLISRSDILRYTYMTDLHGQQLNLAETIAYPKIEQLANNYAKCHIISLLQPLRETLYYAGSVSQAIHCKDGTLRIPYMSDFLVYLDLAKSKSQILKKQKWP
ncbi:hypothetical protein [Poriferisphaera sp. WC338]|uniref:hypothetical protein n=1 Tax=Poriferisphaera sp. WC338 TaxID=3425129 RepID=UPI003D814320